MPSRTKLCESRWHFSSLVAWRSTIVSPPRAFSVKLAITGCQVTGIRFRERAIDNDGNTTVKSTLLPGTTIRRVSDIYQFDQELRAVLFDALETVEIAIRFQVGHTLGRRNPFAHRDPGSLSPAFAAVPQVPAEPSPPHGETVDAELVHLSRHQEWLDHFDEQERRSQEAFAAHFRDKYGPHLPVWVATEVMSFGTLGQLYDGAAEDDRARIAANLDLIGKDGKGDAALLSNWLNHIRYIRNLCAHHSRLWNRTFDVELASPALIPDLAHSTGKSQRRLYGTISTLTFLLARTMPSSTWRLHVRDLNRPGFDGGSVYLFPAPVGTLLRL